MILKNSYQVAFFAKRSFYHWLNKIWNNVDVERIRAVGPDRACAEWLLRNGAFVKWTGGREYVTDYNTLPPENVKLFIEEVDATNSSIMDAGFAHFEGCNHIKSMKLHKCHNIFDDALMSLSILKDSLKHLQVSSCGNITDKGLHSLVYLEKLESLLLFDLQSVKNKEVSLRILKEALKFCDIEFK